MRTCWMTLILNNTKGLSEIEYYVFPYKELIRLYEKALRWSLIVGHKNGEQLQTYERHKEVFNKLKEHCIFGKLIISPFCSCVKYYKGLTPTYIIGNNLFTFNNRDNLKKIIFHLSCRWKYDNFNLIIHYDHSLVGYTINFWSFS